MLAPDDSPGSARARFGDAFGDRLRQADILALGFLGEFISGWDLHHILSVALEAPCIFSSCDIVGF